jgi:hypothetical protein
MSQKKHPSTELLKDLKKIYAKHNWSGHAIGIRVASANIGAGGCPQGQTPKEITYQLPDGTWVNKTICI